MAEVKKYRVLVYLEFDPKDMTEGWKDDDDFESSLRARLDEVYDASGNPVTPKFVGYDIEED